LQNAVRGIVRRLVRDRSNGTDRSASGPTQPATARHVHRRAIGAARFLAHFLTPTPRSRERLASQTERPQLATTRSRSARRRLYRRRLAFRLASNRTVPAAIALIVVPRIRGRWRWVFPALAVVMPVLVAVSRMYRGMHHPTDLLGAVLLSACWLTVLYWTVRPGEHAESVAEAAAEARRAAPVSVSYRPRPTWRSGPSSRPRQP